LRAQTRSFEVMNTRAEIAHPAGNEAGILAEPYESDGAARQNMEAANSRPS